jgi:hypothetical protein
MMRFGTGRPHPIPVLARTLATVIQRMMKYLDLQVLFLYLARKYHIRCPNELDSHLLLRLEE